ncbi:transposase [Tenacibaculum vairaonense]|uniref:transposase n=1 Tax=Tenacibaculum vairaonense TaxID=3137860 RepID=UPI0031FB4BCE
MDNKILKKDTERRVRELIREVCKVNEVETIKGYVSIDNVHLFVSVPSHISVSKLMQYIKEKLLFFLYKKRFPFTRTFL